MGILDILDKDKRAARKVEKAIKRLTNPYMQSEERMKSADFLREEASDKAVYGLLKRFRIKASNQVVDEDEKQQVYVMVVDLGKRAVPALVRFIGCEDQIRHPLKALTEIVSTDELVEQVGAALVAIGPDYIKNPEPKLHLVQHLETLDDPRVAEILAPFAEDHDETIRFQVVHALASRPGSVAHEALVGRLLSEEDESLRTAQAICEVLSAAQFSVGEARREAVAKALPSGWTVDEQGRVQKGA